MKHFYSRIKKFLNIALFLGIFLQSYLGTSQTTLAKGDIIFTGYDSSVNASDIDSFSFVALVPISATTVIYFTDRGYFEDGSWRAAGASEGTISWTVSNAIAAGTEITIKGNTVSTFNYSSGITASNGSIAITEGTMALATGLSLSNIGDQVIAFQGGSGSPAGVGANMVSGLHYYYCPTGGGSTQAHWDQDLCANGTAGSIIPPGLIGGFSAFYSAEGGTTTYTSGKFNGSGNLTTTANIRTAVMNINNWSNSAISQTLPTGAAFLSAPPVVTANPSSVTVCSGSNTAFSVSATGATSYQWQVDTGGGFANLSNGAPYSGVTTATLTITGATSAMNLYQYRCVVTGAGSVNSTAATLSVPTAISSSVQSQSNVSTYNGTNGSATITVSGGTAPYFYSWAPSGGTSATATNLSAGTYTVTITDSTPNGLGGCTATQNVTITQPAGVSASTSALSAFSSCSGSASTPQSFTVSGGSLTSNLLVSAPIGYEISTSSGGSYSSNISFTPTAGTVATTTIYARLSNTASGTPTGNITVSSNTAVTQNVAVTGTVSAPPAITSQPSASTICAGANTTFTATASNATGYQWQVDQGAGFNNISNNAQYSGATTATLTITGATAGISGYLYRVVASGSCAPNAVSSNAALAVNSAPAITSQPSASTICAGANTTFTTTASNATGYQWQVDEGAGFNNITNNAQYSGATTATLTITGATAGLNGYLYRVIASGACTPNAVSSNVALTINSAPSITSQPSASTICAGANTSFSVTASNATGYQWQVDQGAGFNNISNNAQYSGATTATLTITGATVGISGYLYRVIASGACTPNAVSNNVAITVNSAPAVTSQPFASTICAGANTTFSVAASNATGYQWQVNEGLGFTNISNSAIYAGATSGTLTINSATAAMNGFLYRAIVNGVCLPNATSNNAALTVNSAPAITSQPSASTICAGANTTFSATASSATAYQWQVNQGAGFTNIADDATYSGSNTATLSITGATNGYNGYLYRVVASGVCSPSATSLTAALTVNSAPAITSQPISTIACIGSNTSFTATASNATGYQWQVDQGAGFTNLSNDATYSGVNTATLSITGATAALSGYLYRVIASGVCSPSATSFNAVLTVPFIAVTSTQVDVSCNGANNGSLTVTPSGGSIPYTYLWSNGETTASIANLAPGNYTVTIKDANLCEKTENFTITEPTALTASQGTINNVSCNSGANGTATVIVSGGTPGYTYSWAPYGGTSATATGLSQGTFTVTVTDANACTTTQNFTINEPPILTTTPSQTNILCNGGATGSASVTVSGGTGAYSYSWIPSGGTAATATGLTAGIYTVTVTDANNCQINQSFTITEPAVLTVNPVAATNIACFGESTGSATVAVSGGTGAYSYSWAPSGGTAATATGLVAGTYTVTVTDANGCIGTQSFTLTEPSAALSASSSSTPVSCNGGSNGTATVVVSGGTPSYTYSWAPFGGTAATATGLSAGTYTVTVTDANGCTITENVTVNSPSPFVGTINKTDVSCNGGSNGTATITASGATAPYTYQWSPSGGTAATATGLAAGTYTITVTDANGCSYQETVIIDQPAILDAAQSQTNVLCNGSATGTATVTPTGGSGSYTYLWSPSGGTAATATGLTLGNYSVLITDGNGCSILKNFTITEPSVLTATTSQINATCTVGGEATVNPAGGTAPYSYLWSDGQTTATATGLTAGNHSVIITDSNGCIIGKNFTITTTNTLVASTSQIDVLCNGGNTGSATVVPSGAAGPFTYVWTPSGGNADTATGLTAGNYSVTITAANGCSIVKNFTITEPTAIGITPSQINVTCPSGSNGSATVSVTGGTGSYTYSWAPSGGTAATATGLAAGTYVVTVTDANGCTATQSFTITQPDPILATVSQTEVSCNGGANGTATLTVTGGTGTYTYAWAPYGGTAATATGLAAGTYTVTITDANGCLKTESVTITEPAVLSASALVQTNILCNGGTNGSATVSVTGGTAPYTYSWAPYGGTAATATGLAAGTYTITVTDANGCTATQSYTITEPTALAATSSHTDASCNGGTNGTATVVVTGGTGAYTYLWSPSGGTAATASGLSAGTYTVIATDANGCTISESVTITEPTAISITSSSTNVSCNAGANGSASVNVTGGTGAYTYSWAPFGGTAATASGLSAGTYTVTVTDANGCTATETVVVTEPAAISAVASQTNVSCNGSNDGSATVTVTGGTGAYTYAWSPSGGTAATATGLAAGTYTVTVTDANGCTTSTSAIITEPSALSASITGTNVSCNGSNDGSATVTVTGGTGSYTYAWSPSGGTAATATGLTAGTYTVTITDANGCTTSGNVTIGTNPDTTAPVPTLATLPQITGDCSVLASQIAIPTALDNCAGTINGTTTDPLTYTAAGTYTITWSYDDGNGNVSTQLQTVTVNASPLDAVTFSNAQVTYDGTAHSIQVANLPTGATVTYSANNGATNAGTYAITATVTPASTSPNCSAITLNANLVINKAPQQITFNAIPVKTLGLNNTFNLDAVSDSNLPVTYTYTFDSPTPAATVTPSGQVTMTSSGEILITAHQAGDNNYLPAADVSQLLVILNNNVDVTRITIGNKVFDNPAKTITHVLACGETNPNITVLNESGAVITPSANFTIQTPKAGIYTQDVTVTSQDGTLSATYTITVEKPFNFFDIVQQKFNNVLLVNNNPQTNGGYEFTAYQWFKNGQLIGTGQYYSAGETITSLLDPNAQYMVKMTTKDGKVLQTCPTQITLKNSLQAKLYPNPIETGKAITIEADFPTEELEKMQISLFSVSGQLVKTVQSSSAKTEIQLPETAAGNTLLVVLETPNIKKSFKVIVK
ncbi:T9SS type A sorting domain-containing protein [Flavobacterium endoglycinae]|uniref:T9SS type A sorting domain-containing protein n=1 Tax=Flavobacterium endoglycinae TaxID=2816357 RepID=A0ABX7QDR8_9FLAO|nr:T9SS type A sorting domain-containing protein [Flavobacterium endoglycinae]QSW88743.1 T9SS type A sorting domain-containing protein [Flavobacterium endoglycinae]